MSVSQRTDSYARRLIASYGRLGKPKGQSHHDHCDKGERRDIAGSYPLRAGCLRPGLFLWYCRPMRYIVLFWVCLILWAVLYPGLQFRTKPPEQTGHGEAIQGLYSHLNCDSQPGTKPWYETVKTVNALGEESYLIYFLGCR